MASTYPLEIVEASRWIKKNAGLKGDALEAALKNQDWGPERQVAVHVARRVDQDE